jgi:hypothetical protein
MTKLEISPEEYNAYYQTYINYVPENKSLLEAFSEDLFNTVALLESIPEDRFNFKYAPNKWTIKEVVQHIIDTERIFAYRALSFSRKEAASLPGFDQDNYVANSFANDRSKSSLIDDFKQNRAATIHLFSSFNQAMLQEIGTASNAPASPRAIGFITVGHTMHHAKVLREHYIK